MDSSTSAEPPPQFTPREVVLDTIAAQTAAIDELIGMAQQRLQVFDVDLSQGGWNTIARADNLTKFLRRSADARFDLILHDARWMETSCPRLMRLLRVYSHAITMYRTGAEAKAAMDPLLIVDSRHFLHRFHFDHARAMFAIEQAQLARPLVMRFDQIWATGEPGLGGTVLGI